MISSQSINGFYRDKLGKHPTDLYMVQSGPIPDSIWSTGYNTSVLMDYFGPNGQNYIPQSIGELHDWRDMRDATPLCNALNEGSFLTLYRGHSNYTVLPPSSFLLVATPCFLTIGNDVSSMPSASKKTVVPWVALVQPPSPIPISTTYLLGEYTIASGPIFFPTWVATRHQNSSGLPTCYLRQSIISPITSSCPTGGLMSTFPP